MKYIRSVAAKFFQDKHGRVIIWQWPNLPLWSWIICTVVGRIVTKGTVHLWVANAGMALLFTWAYLEITEGASYFRRALGTLVMAVLLVGFASVIK